MKDEIAKAICPKCKKKDLVYNLDKQILECLFCRYYSKLSKFAFPKQEVKK